MRFALNEIEHRAKALKPIGTKTMKITGSSPRTFTDPVCLMDVVSGMENPHHLKRRLK
jgi:hypothetical protein